MGNVMFTKKPFSSAESIYQGTCNDIKKNNKKQKKSKKQLKYTKENFTNNNTKTFQTIKSKTMYQHIKNNKTSKTITISLFNTTKFIFNNILSTIPLLEEKN